MSRRLRVAIDAHTVGRRQTGNERYVVGLAGALAARDDIEALVYVDEGVDWPAENGPSPQLRRLRLRRPQLRIPLELPIRARRDRADLLHVSYVTPPLAGLPLVTTVHDLSFEDVPRLVPRAMRLRLKVTVRRAVGKSAAIMTGSEFTRRRVIEVYGANPERVHAVPYGVGTRWRPMAEEEAARALRAVIPPRRFVLAVGTDHPRKNLARAADAVARLRSSGLPDLELVIAGPAARPAAPGTEMATGVATGWIQLAGFVSDDELHALYCLADAVVYPSLYEGFGLPVLEALASGAVLVVSDSTALPEAAGDAALLVDPSDTEAISESLRRVLTDESLRARLRLAGPAHAAQFTWQRCAAGTVAAYRSALAAG